MANLTRVLIWLQQHIENVIDAHACSDYPYIPNLSNGKLSGEGDMPYSILSACSYNIRKEIYLSLYTCS